MKLISNCIHIHISKINFIASIKPFNNYFKFYSHRETSKSTDKGKQPIESNKVSAIAHEEPPFRIPFTSFYPTHSAASQILIDNIWSACLSGQCNSLMRKHLSDLANHIKYLEAKIQMLEQHFAPSSIPPIEYRIQLLEKVNTLLPDDLAARIRDETLSSQIIERLTHQACYLSWATGFPKMFLPAEEFDISHIEQGLVYRFILDKDNLAIIRQLPAIVKYALNCLGITKRNILITVSSTVGERDEFRFYQPHQLWTLMNYEDGDLFCQKYSIPINDYEHLPDRNWNQTERFESSDAATLSYSLERL
eukprot:TRINITY_DN10108_c0_g2_i1.p1 TRINITY_DN10108_c0_g2~~TRINITY_DN10108_c0_g2_i1.p1  ORF type:complete len:307 (-),score=26.94 TRINITY_DN10108_c0_g2_i1:323-1243(-)